MCSLLMALPLLLKDKRKIPFSKHSLKLQQEKYVLYLEILMHTHLGLRLSVDDEWHDVRDSHGYGNLSEPGKELLFFL